MDKKIGHRYLELRSKMVSSFKNCEGASTFNFMFSSMDNINHLILDSCVDDGKVLSLYKRTPSNVLFQILRIAKKPVLFRELEQAIPIIFNSYESLVEAFMVLYSINSIDYDLRTGYEGPKNSIFLYIIEDEFNPDLKSKEE